MIKKISLAILSFFLFNVIYNATVIAFSKDAFDFEMSLLQDQLSSLLYGRIGNDLIWSFAQYKLLLFVLHCFFSCLWIIIGYGIIYHLSYRKNPTLRHGKHWRTSIRFTLLSTYVLAILIWIVSYIWASQNRDISWFSKDVIFERYLPSVWMFENKFLYLFCGVIFTFIYMSKKKPSANNA